MHKRKPCILPIHVGSLIVDKSLFTYRMNIGQAIEVPVFIWLISIPNHEPILVDTGFKIESFTTMLHYPTVQTKLQTPSEALRINGYKPEDFKQIILSHLHWDHCSNNALFPNASFIVQKDEMEYAAQPLQAHETLYEIGISGYKPPYEDKDVSYKIIDGNYRIVEGVNIIKAPGHTPGMQVVTVETSKGVYCIASDNIPLYENIHLNQPSSIWPSGCFCNLVDYYHSLNTIKNIADYILPGHETNLIGQVFP